MTTNTQETTARKRWELENDIKEEDKIYELDQDQYEEVLKQQPWKKNPKYFTKVKISAIALIKMSIHARSGGDIEIMGLMQGKVVGDTMYVMDSVALPVEGTETRVNAQTEAFEYMSAYFNSMERIGKNEKAIGWYHSHPGYGCWLSGIDVSTQMLNQKFSEPWLAIVIDPKRTIASGKVELGAFRTFPEGYVPSDSSPSEYQTIPLNKIEDFGVHANAYYPLEVSYFKSSLDTYLIDLLWHKYWVNTLSSSPIYLNRDYTSGQIMDLAEKLENAESKLNSYGGFGMLSNAPAKDKKEESQLSKLTKDGVKITSEQLHGLMTQVLKDILFNSVGKDNSKTPEQMDIE